jgi:hypothetical protein
MNHINAGKLDVPFPGIEVSPEMLLRGTHRIPILEGDLDIYRVFNGTWERPGASSAVIDLFCHQSIL